MQPDHVVQVLQEAEGQLALPVIQVLLDQQEVGDQLALRVIQALPVLRELQGLLVFKV